MIADGTITKPSMFYSELNFYPASNLYCRLNQNGLNARLEATQQKFIPFQYEDSIFVGSNKSSSPQEFNSYPREYQSLGGIVLLILGFIVGYGAGGGFNRQSLTSTRELEKIKGTIERKITACSAEGRDKGLSAERAMINAYSRFAEPGEIETEHKERAIKLTDYLETKLEEDYSPSARDGNEEDDLKNIEREKTASKEPIEAEGNEEAAPDNDSNEAAEAAAEPSSD